MPKLHKPTPRAKHAGGPVKKQQVANRTGEPKYDKLPPGEGGPSQPGPGVPVIRKTIVVRDEQGQVVSITNIAPGARFGVGVKPKPGQTVTEYAAGTFTEDPFLQQRKERRVEPRPSLGEKKKH